MPNSYFSPNKSISGGALFASFNSKDGAVYFKLLKQIANNPDKKGNFDGQNPINIKLGQDECAGIIRAIRQNGESKFYHSFKENITSGRFAFYTIEPKGDAPKRSGFGLSVKRSIGGQTTEVKIGFTLDSAERLSLFLKTALVHIFDAEYAQDVKESKEYLAKKNAKTDNPKTEPEKTTEPEEPVQDDVDF